MCVAAARPLKGTTRLSFGEAQPLPGGCHCTPSPSHPHPRAAEALGAITGYAAQPSPSHQPHWPARGRLISNGIFQGEVQVLQYSQHFYSERFSSIQFIHGLTDHHTCLILELYLTPKGPRPLCQPLAPRGSLPMDLPVQHVL